jgi:hypothetical protein
MVSAAKVRPILGQLPENHARAGTRVTVDELASMALDQSLKPKTRQDAADARDFLTRLGLDGIDYDSRGFPDFTSIAYREGSVVADVRINYTGSRGRDFTAADEAMRKKLGDPSWRRDADNWTWHHHQDIGNKGEGGRMILVRTSVHAALKHSGGVAIYRMMTGQLDQYSRRRAASQ